MTYFPTARNTPGDPIRTVKTKEVIMELSNIAVSVEYVGTAGWRFCISICNAYYSSFMCSS